MLPYEWGVQSKDYFIEQGTDSTFKSYPVDPTVSAENQQDLTAFLEANIS